MNNNKITNPKTEVPIGIEMNEKDYLTCLLGILKELEKNQSNQEGANLEISDRSYYSNHLTDSVFKTKISYVPTDSLL